MPEPPDNSAITQQKALLYHFCRLQLPAVVLTPDDCERHLLRTYHLYERRAAESASWQHFLENLYPLDWYLACACLQGNPKAWEQLFAARAGRSDCLLLDALRGRAARLYPRNEERQESAVNEFWGHLYIATTPEGVPVLGRYDGLRPLVPWLIRVFQNWHISQLRRHSGVQALPEDDLALPLPEDHEARWHDAFCQATRDCLSLLKDKELLILGLRLRYRMSQREVANLLEMHEGTVSRRTDQLREQCLEYIGKQLVAQGWTGDDLSEFVRTEMHNLLLDDPRLSADHLAKLIAAQGKQLPESV
jgi:RNA polymerase sigma factor (sigma-70 family)